ncbi:MAG: signal peptidase II [Candidatus Omnitrophica bacterium]|nr:signal peptidase II [Candidatus Omnitrophota bacterium]
MNQEINIEKKTKTDPSPPSSYSRASRRDIVWILGIAVFTFIFDLVTKIWAVRRLEGQPPIDIIPGVFRFAYGENTGIAFGLFQDHGGLLHILSPLAFIILLVILYKMFAEYSMDVWYRIIFGLLIGGALGNILNRLYCGYVVDFIDVFIGTYNWPTFNIADSALTVGEVILVAKILIEELALHKKKDNLEEEIPAKESD